MPRSTRRLVLRDLVPEDVDALLRVLGDPETMRFYPGAFDRDRTLQWIEANRDSYRTKGYGLWALVLRDTDELVGDCGITDQRVDDETFPELGWHVRRDLWGRGLATEAAIVCRDRAFDDLGLGALISLVRPENVASCRVAEKTGMSIWKTVTKGHQGWLHRVYRVDRPSSPLT